MAQAGIHAMVASAVRKWIPAREWMMLGVVLGNLFPDMDNIAVAVATVMKLPTAGLHRTFTHSLFTVTAALAFFYILAAVTKKPRWNNFGIGFGVGILMHILLDLLIWFNGVEVLWPLHSWVNLWEGFVVPAWLDKILMTTEFLFFGLFFLLLTSLAKKHKTDGEYSGKLRQWANVQFGLFVLFTVLAFLMTKGFLTIYGALYLLSLFLAFGVTIRMKKTVEAV